MNKVFANTYVFKVVCVQSAMYKDMNK